jgi:hypothetical protein
MASQVEPVWFEASEDRLYQAAVRTAATLGYSLKHSDTTARVISFNTGMSMRSWAGQDMSVSVISGENGKNGLLIGGTRAQLSGFMGGTPQVYDWGESGKISRKFLDTFRPMLAKIPEPKPPQAPAAQMPSTATLPVFEPEAVYEGVPYRVVGNQYIEALMGGHLVRFKSGEQFAAAIAGKSAK